MCRTRSFDTNESIPVPLWDYMGHGLSLCLQVKRVLGAISAPPVETFVLVSLCSYRLVPWIFLFVFFAASITDEVTGLELAVDLRKYSGSLYFDLRNQEIRVND